MGAACCRGLLLMLYETFETCPTIVRSPCYSRIGCGTWNKKITQFGASAFTIHTGIFIDVQ
jgi:hypothetical protein